MNYYQEIQIKIKEHLQNEQFEEALILIESELAMPYMPQEFQDQLIDYKKECLSALNQAPSYAMSFDVIANWLFELDALKVEAAILALSEVNLRNHLKEVESLLKTHPDPMITSMILLECVNQSVDAPFKFHKTGLDFEVNPLYIEHPTDSDGYQVAYKKLSELTFKEPSFTELCHKMLVKEVLVALPISYSEEEGEMLAYSIIREGFKLLNRELEWYNFKVDNNIEEEQCPSLISTH